MKLEKAEQLIAEKKVPFDSVEEMSAYFVIEKPRVRIAESSYMVKKTFKSSGKTYHKGDVLVLQDSEAAKLSKKGLINY